MLDNVFDLLIHSFLLYHLLQYVLEADREELSAGEVGGSITTVVVVGIAASNPTCQRTLSIK